MVAILTSEYNLSHQTWIGLCCISLHNELSEGPLGRINTERTSVPLFLGWAVGSRGHTPQL